MGCPLDGGDNIKKKENKCYALGQGGLMLCPRSRGVNAPSIVRVATRYGWEQVHLPRSTYVIEYYWYKQY